MFLSYNRVKKTKGFSLIEVLITLAIIGIVLAMSVSHYKSFNGIVLLKNMAFQIALDIRQAQVYAASVRADDFTEGELNAAELRHPVGVRFDLMSPTVYTLYLDVDENGSYSASIDDPIGDFTAGHGTISLDNRFIITGLCVVIDSGTCHPKDSVDITFERPDFEALIRYAPGGGDGAIARITIASKNAVNDPEFSRVVEVYSTGQISVVAHKLK